MVELSTGRSRTSYDVNFPSRSKEFHEETAPKPDPNIQAPEASHSADVGLQGSEISSGAEKDSEKVRIFDRTTKEFVSIDLPHVATSCLVGDSRCHCQIWEMEIDIEGSEDADKSDTEGRGNAVSNAAHSSNTTQSRTTSSSMSNATAEPKRDFLGRVIADEVAADAGGSAGVGRTESKRGEDDSRSHTQNGDSAEITDAIGSFVREQLRQKSVAACEHFLEQGSGKN
jgi:hypothetical protein